MFAGVPERRVPEIVSKRDGFGKMIIKTKRTGNRSRDLGGLHRMRQPRSIVVALAIHEDLSFVLESSKGLGMDNAIAIPFETETEVVFRFSV